MYVYCMLQTSFEKKQNKGTPTFVRCVSAQHSASCASSGSFEERRFLQ